MSECGDSIEEMQSRVDELADFIKKEIGIYADVPKYIKRKNKLRRDMITGWLLLAMAVIVYVLPCLTTKIFFETDLADKIASYASSLSACLVAASFMWHVLTLKKEEESRGSESIKKILRYEANEQKVAELELLTKKIEEKKKKSQD